MQFRAFYSDGRQPRHDTTFEAPDHRSAAQQLFHQHPVSSDRRISVETISYRDYSMQQFQAREFMGEQAVALSVDSPATPPTNPAPLMPGLAVAFRVFGALEFIGGFVWCIVLWPGQPGEGYEWKSSVYVLPLTFLMAGIIFGCLFLAVADVLIYLRGIRDVLRKQT